MIGFFVQSQASSNKQMYSNLKNKPLGRMPDFFQLSELTKNTIGLAGSPVKLGAALR